MLTNMKLGTRFTLLMFLIFAIGAAASTAAFLRAAEGVAEESVTTDSLNLLQTMNSVRGYTTNNIDPLIAPVQATQSSFILESVPAFSARAVFENFRALPAYQRYRYKEAAFNPTNPRNRVDGYEATLLDTLRSNPGAQQLSGFRDLDGSPVFYIARPMRVGASCLQCHDTPDTAPASMVALYGPVNGFGWKLDEVIAAQIIYVPAQVVYDYRDRALLLVLAIAGAGFAVVAIASNVLLRRSVVGPIGRIADVARRIAASEVDEGEPERLSFLARRSDELGELARVFQAMAREVHAREERSRQRLQELRVEVDEAKKRRQVEEITETEYFQDLQKKAKELRSKQGTSPDEETRSP